MTSAYSRYSIILLRSLRDQWYYPDFIDEEIQARSAFDCTARNSDSFSFCYYTMKAVVNSES